MMEAVCTSENWSTSTLHGVISQKAIIFIPAPPQGASSSSKTYGGRELINSTLYGSHVSVEKNKLSGSTRKKPKN
jgi:hypothetical protein